MVLKVSGGSVIARWHRAHHLAQRGNPKSGEKRQCGWQKEDHRGIRCTVIRMESRAGKKKTYNSRCSLAVTDPATNLPLTSLTMGERTRPRAAW